ncbi:hypothetical protein FFLO_03503 [Filobasidium floriforme]|uniref:Uncharacterized protein n=1 Tax=Filobasidium floriforme TaxID=5210 RepID=A0A8K0JM01_9TREE|nr:uncharacterized protein HD553DRAFT_335432 [Filobasidium floriforme]KAG7535983.1 hypothetical protein FFLO_03503 [Filobasidium floriforme]KAH8084809.1 hypothetical protein HD553DRAFT_335432 [Filobasidium floriforme]
MVVAAFCVHNGGPKEVRGGPINRSIEKREARGAWVVLFRARDRTKRERPAPHGAPLPLAPCVSSFINLITSSLMETTNTDERRQGSQRGKRYHKRVQENQRAYLIRPSVVTHPAVIVILSSSHPRPRPKNHTSYFLVSPQGTPEHSQSHRASFAVVFNGVRVTNHLNPDPLGRASEELGHVRNFDGDNVEDRKVHKLQVADSNTVASGNLRVDHSVDHFDPLENRLFRHTHQTSSGKQGATQQVLL